MARRLLFAISLLLVLGLVPSVVLAQISRDSYYLWDRLEPTDEIVNVKTIQTGTDSHVMVLSTLRVDGKRMGAFLVCDEGNPRITFQFYSGIDAVRLWVRNRSKRVSYGVHAHRNPQTGIYSPMFEGDVARDIANNLLREGASFGDSATIRISVPAAPYKHHLQKLRCFKKAGKPLRGKDLE